MTATGVVCEYNPIHNGHAHHLAETRKRTGGAIICVMSGNFVQRGEPAVFPKHIRAEAAIKAGADLVIELPINCALSSAEGFAAGAVRLLAGLGDVDAISFGSESGDAELIRRSAELLLSDDCIALTRENLSSGISYAAARERAFVSLGGDAEILRRPNDILAVEYAKSVIKYAPGLKLCAVKRTGAKHGDSDGCSSTALRELMRRGESAADFMPDACAEVYDRAAGEGIAPVFASDDIMLSRLRMMSESDFERLPDSGEGLYRRLYRNAVTCASVDEIIEKTKTKRYAYSRIKRMVMCACIGLTEDIMRIPPMFVRVLAADETGRSLLRELRKTCTLPIITKPADGLALAGDALRIFTLTSSATDFYALMMRGRYRAGGGEMRRSPVML